MSSKNLIWIIGIFFIGSGILLIATDYKNLKDTYQKYYYQYSHYLTPQEIQEKEPQPNTKEKLKSDLKMAEEYLRQNSYESIRKALDIYNRVLSFSNDLKISQLAKYGLSYALFRLKDENRALLHLRELKRQRILDPILEEEINFLLGKILLLRGHEEEGKAILRNLLAKTKSNDMKSRIHTTFGDFYQLKKEYKKAKKSYLIALEYNPDNLHAEIIKENLKLKNKEIIPFQHEYYDQNLYHRIISKPRKVKKIKKEKKETKLPKTQKKEEFHINETIEKLKRDIAIATSLMNQNQYARANNQFMKTEKEIKKFLSYPSLKESHKNSLYSLLENVYYRLGEIAEKQSNLELAKAYYDKVLSTPVLELDQAALIRKGIIYFEQDQFQKAYQFFQKAIEVNPNGKFTSRAMEWLKETERILGEQG